MAERRMFAKTIIDSDAFLDMPLSAQALYFHLSMRADDDGFLNNPKKIQRMVGASDDDFKILIMKRFIITFENGVVVIKHWKIHNYIRNDRYKPTIYAEEKAQLEEKENSAYTERKSLGIPNGYQMETQVRDSIEIDKDIYINIVSYLNEKAKTKYKHSSKKTKSHIKARLDEGFTLEDFKTVIDKKCAEWLGTNFEQYLRPETLFGTKFESYLNAKVTTKADSIDSSKNDLDDLF